MKNILVPIGNNNKTANTLQYAIDFAEKVDAKIYLIHVFTSSKVSGSFVNIDPILEKESKEILEECLSKVNTKNVEIISSTLKSHSIVDTLKQLIKLLKIDLIITSTKNEGTDDTIFLGKITGSIIKDTETPVLVIPAKASFRPISKILMTIKSGSINSVTTLDLLEKIQKTFNTTIHLLQVKTPKLKTEELTLNKKLKEMIATLISTNNATVFQGVLEFLQVENPDMVCVIRRKRGFFKKLWEEDKVKKIDFDSNVPVLVLKGLS